MKQQKGSILLLTMICVMILSLLALGLLSVGTTEMHTTQNSALNKSAFYDAVQGVEEIREQIYQNPDPVIVEQIYKIQSMTEANTAGLKRWYITGSMINMQDNTYRNVALLNEFRAPPPPSVSSNITVVALVWDVTITAKVESGVNRKKAAYSEVEAGIYSIVDTSH